MKLEDIRAERDDKIARLLRYFGVIMAIFYFAMGLTILLTPLFNGLSEMIRYGISSLLIIYGVWRFYRFVSSFKTNHSSTINSQSHEE